MLQNLRFVPPVPTVALNCFVVSGPKPNIVHLLQTCPTVVYASFVPQAMGLVLPLTSVQMGLPSGEILVTTLKTA